MRTRIAVLILFACVALVSTATTARADMCVAVDVRFPDSTPTAALVRSMRDEVAAIWLPYGVHVLPAEEIECECAHLGGSFDVVVSRSRSRHAVNTNGGVLGRTHLQPGSIDHAPIQIDSEATKLALESLGVQMTGLTGHPVLTSTEIGRALGRVLAHEIGHVLLAAPNHQRQGLMRPSYPPADLASIQRWTFTLSPGELVRLRQREGILGATTGVNRPD